MEEEGILSTQKQPQLLSAPLLQPKPHPDDVAGDSSFFKTCFNGLNALSGSWFLFCPLLSICFHGIKSIQSITNPLRLGLYYSVVTIKVGIFNVHVCFYEVGDKWQYIDKAKKKFRNLCTVYLAYRQTFICMLIDCCDFIITVWICWCLECVLFFWYWIIIFMGLIL